MNLLLLAIILAPLAAAVVCLAGSRRLPARPMGLLGAAALLLGLLALAALWMRGLPAESGALPWATLGEASISLRLRVDALSAPLLALTLGGGALALIALALAFAPSTRGFGGLFAAVLFALAGTLVTLTSPEGPLLPLGWALVALSGYAGARLAGASEAEGDMPVGIAVSLLAALLLALALLLGVRLGQPGGTAAGMARGGPALVLLLLAGAAASSSAAPPCCGLASFLPPPPPPAWLRRRSRWGCRCWGPTRCCGSASPRRRWIRPGGSH
jgi:NADH:ubiquinone oxidoreductase subunit 5 (subunit L)/multisubunit Na+/H+ antiporter MnhA subunit